MTQLPQDAQPAPIEHCDGGVYRIRGTRVPLEMIVGAFQVGMSAEGIADAFPALTLPDVYAVIAYNLRHRLQVDEYVTGQKADATSAVSREIAKPEYQAWRDRLLARAGRVAKAG